MQTSHVLCWSFAQLMSRNFNKLQTTGPVPLLIGQTRVTLLTYLLFRLI